MPRAFPNFAIPVPDASVHTEMYDWAADLFPLCRSLTGNGVRATLQYLRDRVPEIGIQEIASGTPCFDWVVPDEWNITQAYLIGPDGARVVDFQNSNLHVVGYSLPVDVQLSLEDLLPRLHSDEGQPDAIPYVTSYYKSTWGFCLSHKQRVALKPGRYRAVIKSTLAPGSLTYAEALLPGETTEEVFLSTYICHPSMANNELSGPVMVAALVRWLARQEHRRYTYRCVWVPETVGAIAYLSRNLEHMKPRTKAGYVVTCVGDNRAYSYLPSRLGDTLADRVALHVLRHHAPGFRAYSFLQRGSDERQYCYPGVDLPVASVMRSKYDTYPEYHTSLDDMSVISAEGLGGTYEIYRRILTGLELNYVFRATTLCEPRLGNKNLYPELSRKEIYDAVIATVNVLSYSDGMHDLIALAERIELPYERCVDLLRALHSAGLVEVAR